MLTAVLACWAILMWETCLRIGHPPLRWASDHAGAGRLERHAVGWLAGVIVLGTAVMAAALTGLCRPVVVLALAAMLAAGGGLRSPTAAWLRALWRAPRPAVWCGAAAIVLVLPAIRSPLLDQDALLYHFGVPWQALQTGRVPLDMVPFVFHHPLPADFANAPALLAGDDRLAKCQSLAALVAALTFALGYATRVSRNGWTAPILLLGLFFVPWLSTTGKNDLAAAGLCLAGALWWRDRRSLTAAMVLGAAIAAKLSCAPIVAVWVAAHPPRRLRAAGAACFAVAIPVLPWLVKAWIATGNPVFPLFWGTFPSPFWDARNQASMDVYDQWLHGAEHPTSVPGIWLREMWSHDPAWLLALPLLALAGRWRVAAALTAAGWGALHIGRMTRYLLPVEWLTAMELGLLATALPGRRGRWLRAGTAVAALAGFALRTDVRTGLQAPATDPYQALREAGRRLHLRGDRRVLATGEWRTHLVPGRILYDGHLGETPIVWSRVRESRDDDRLRIRFRQLGARSILHNVVSVEWMAAHDVPFRWDDRMLKHWHAFCRNRTRPAVPPAVADRTTGAYWILDLDVRPGTPSRGPSPFFLPGAEVVGHSANQFVRAGRPAQAVQEYRRLLVLDPDLGEWRSGLGRARIVGRNWRDAYASFLPAARRGFVDGWNLWGLGIACFELGRLDEAEFWFRRALEVYDTKDENRVNLAAVYAARGRATRSRADLERGLRMLGEITPDPTAPWENDRRIVADSLAQLTELIAR